MRWVWLVLLTGCCWALPVVKLTNSDRARMEALRVQRHGSMFPEARREDGRLYLALAEEATSDEEAEAALRACQLADSGEVTEVCLHLLRSPSPGVREAASFLCRAVYPDPRLFPLLQAAFEAAPNANSRRNILSAATFTTQTASPVLASMLLKGLESQELPVLEAALANLGTRAMKGTDYGPAFWKQAEPLYRAQLTSVHPDLRGRAFAIIYWRTPARRRRSDLTDLFRAGLRDPDGGVVRQTLWFARDALPTGILHDVIELLDDQRSGRFVMESLGGSSGGDASPVQHHALLTLDALSSKLYGARGFHYANRGWTDGQPVRDLKTEVARAKAWVKRNPVARRA